MLYSLITGLLTVMTILVTILIGHLSFGCYCQTYICTLIPIILAEFILGCSLICGCVAKQRNKAFSAGLSIVAALYLFFTFLMLIPFNIGWTLTPMLITHIIVLMLAVILMAIFGMAVNHSNETQASFANKKMFIMEIERFKAEYADLIATSEPLKNQIAELADVLRYASDSVKGAEHADGKLANAIEQLHEAAATGDANKCIDAAAKAIRLNSWRQSVIKEMR